MNGGAQTGTHIFRLQRLHSSDHLTLSLSAQEVFTISRRGYQFRCPVYCVLLPPHFLALEVPFLSIKKSAGTEISVEKPRTLFIFQFLGRLS